MSGLLNLVQKPAAGGHEKRSIECKLPSVNADWPAVDKTQQPFRDRGETAARLPKADDAYGIFVMIADYGTRSLPATLATCGC
jgi:hypothetical protein